MCPINSVAVDESLTMLPTISGSSQMQRESRETTFCSKVDVEAFGKKLA